MDQLKKLLDIYTSFGIEQDYDKLLEKILTEAVDFTHCDAGTLYIREKDQLHFKIVMTKSQNIFKILDSEKGGHKSYPPVAMDRQNACAYCAINKRIVNIEDVYSSAYDFSGPREYDKRTGYKTKSTLIFPIENDFGEVIGVVQLINALEQGEIVAFDTYFHNFLLSFGVQAGMCLNNMSYAKANLEQIYSFVEVLTTAIDELSKFNANHSRNMVKFAEKFFDWMEKQEDTVKLSAKDRDQLLMSIRLHDIGKLTTPQQILNKVSRLDSKLETVENRIEKLILYSKVAYLDKKITYDVYYMNTITLEEAQKLIPKLDKAEFITDEDLAKIEFLGKQKFTSKDGELETVLKEEELTAMLVQKGNLTQEEREIIQNHVSVTEKMLNKIKFTKDFKDVPFWASAHHEFLNGKGYPHQLKAEDLPIPVRILTILDVFEALVAIDRPYKKAKTPEEAGEILRFMVKDGEADGKLVELFLQSKAWE